MTEGIRKQHLPTGCCIPFVRAWPGGQQWTHSGHCQFSPNAKFNNDEIMAIRAHTAEHKEPKPRDESAAVHPACKEAQAEGVRPCSRCAWYLHPEDCECDLCAFYEGNLDRDDDDGEAASG